MTDTSIVDTIHTAVGPVILISGVGLLLLTMTNRLGRTIDRARALAGREAGEQLAILWLRARLLRGAILLASSSALCVALLVILLFVSVLCGADLAWLVGGLFIAGMVLLIGSLVLFLRDVNQSLAALKIELRKRGGPL